MVSVSTDNAFVILALQVKIAELQIFARIIVTIMVNVLTDFVNVILAGREKIV
jgi:hypothetical protein